MPNVNVERALKAYPKIAQYNRMKDMTEPEIADTLRVDIECAKKWIGRGEREEAEQARRSKTWRSHEWGSPHTTGVAGRGGGCLACH